MGCLGNFKNLTFTIMVVLLVLWFSDMETCNARKTGGRHYRQSSRSVGVSLSKNTGRNHHHSNGGGKSKQKAPSPKSPPPPAAGPVETPPPTNIPPPDKSEENAPDPTVFDVLDFGARGDGTTDDTQAFRAAWAAACKIEASIVNVPAEYVFLVGPISFSGPYCQYNIVFQLDGTIVAPTSPSQWGSGILQWLEFTKLVGLTIKGSGTIDGNGAAWWQSSNDDNDPLDDQSKLIVPLNDTTEQNPRIHVI
ncbi:hypothetical protein MIMGU_mgv1a019203mg [Erythranthe guttata]|uniref:Pectate lyase superfamily protein domain-containing protein n=1 Tax=Erythranthe guttata TaxID=4155 RepID=A0A022QXK4_ERYGU|nr:hypothetical protein MIMGU_mgv1a019203mg [Erythranthe guttata]